MAKSKGAPAAGRGKKLSNIKRANIGTNKRLKERRTQIRSSQEAKPRAGGFVKNDNQRKKPRKAMFAFQAAQKAGYFTNKRINYQQKDPEHEAAQKSDGQSDEEEEEELIDDEMEDEDLEFIQSLAGNSDFLSGVEDSITPSNTRKGKKQERENKEASFEERPRVAMKDKSQIASNMKPLLPIKHASGLEYRWIEREEEAKEEEGEEEGEGGEAEKAEGAAEEAEEKLPPISTIQLFAERQEKINEKKQRIATLASSVVENPEKNIWKLKDLRAVLDIRDPSIMVTTRKLAMVSLSEVFKDIAPGYRIREWGEKAKASQQQLSKDAKLKRDFEEGLITNYRHYLEFLERTIREVHKTKAQLKKEREKEEQRAKPRHVLPTEAKLSLAETATRCLCSLLNALPHFNFRTNIISVVSSMMISKHEKISKCCCASMKQVFRRDVTGEVSLEAVRYISRIARNNGYQVSPEVLDTFLSLRIKEVKTGNTAEENRKKMLQQRKEMFKRLSRSQKRYHKRLEVLEKELQATEASENKNKKLKLHTEIVQIVFATYFRILKRATQSVMLPSVLEGLAKFAHLINVEFFDDLIHVLHSLVERGTLKYRESLHCTLTAFHILSGQGDVLNIDPSRFYAHLYVTLPLVHAGMSSGDASLVCECLEVMITKRRKQISVQRVLGYLKRLATLATLALPNAALGYLCALRTFMKWFPKTDVLLDNESTGSGTFLPELEDPEHCHAQNTALWELSIMQNHYHPTVREYATYVSHGCPIKGQVVPGWELLRMSPQDILKEYSPDAMKFNPPLPPKQPVVVGRKAQRAVEKQIREAGKSFVQEDFQSYVDQSQESIPESETVDFSSALLHHKIKEEDNAVSATKTKRKRRTEIEDSGDVISNGQTSKAVKSMKRTLKAKREKKAR